jgi:hypothetical protein
MSLSELSRQFIAPIAASAVTGIAVGVITTSYMTGQYVARLEVEEQISEELKNSDMLLRQQLERIDREGTQVSRAARDSVTNMTSRLDRMEANQNVALAQASRVEALLLDLKHRLQQ